MSWYGQYSSAEQQPSPPTSEPGQPTEKRDLNPYGYHSYYLDYRQHPSSTAEPTQPTKETDLNPHEYHSYSLDYYQQRPSFPEEPIQSAEMPDPYLNGHLMEPPQDLAESSQVPEIFFCLHSGCKAKPFKRAADLQRHYRNAHVPEPLKEQHFCDYSRCSRYREPFSRRDHLRDHLRQYHREDIPKRNAVIKKEWLEGRESASSWWRCVRCLARVYVSENDFECPKCKTACEPMRKEKRRQKH